MAANVKTIVLRTAGTNCDGETVFAFEQSGSDVELVHINRLFSGEKKLSDYQILAIPGGFSYGDDIISGRILANELRLRLGEDIAKFIASGKLIIGICNGFQVLVRAGILAGPLTADEPVSDFTQNTTLTYNDSGKFEDRWVYLKTSGKSVWTKGLDPVIAVPVAHGEGKFVTRDAQVLKKLQDNNQVVFRYCDEKGGPVSYPGDPNGSVDRIAGIGDATGKILGMMPHPERHFLTTQHPSWTRLAKKRELGQGAKMFQNGVEYIKRNL